MPIHAKVLIVNKPIQVRMLQVQDRMLQVNNLNRILRTILHPSPTKSSSRTSPSLTSAYQVAGDSAEDIVWVEVETR